MFSARAPPNFNFFVKFAGCRINLMPVIHLLGKSIPHLNYYFPSNSLDFLIVELCYIFLIHLFFQMKVSSLFNCSS